jgi:hypothetical protein
MKIVYWLLGIALAVPLLFLATMYGASELGGEVVTLDRTEANGDVSRIRVWIVDSDGISWVEHGEADAPWITRLSNSPEVVLAREGQPNHYIGTPDRGAHARYHRLRRAKYGTADRVIELLTGDTAECRSVPVRLEIAE